MLVIGTIFGSRPTAMVNLKMKQICYDNLGEKKIIFFTEKVENWTGASNRNAGKRKAIKKNLMHIPAFEMSLLDGIFNVFQILNDLLNLRINLKFFLTVSPFGGISTPALWEMFPNVDIKGKHLFEKFAKNMCMNSGVCRSGTHDYIALHVFQSKMTFLLNESGQSDTSVVSRSIDTDTDTLARYNKLKSLNGLKQQVKIFWSVLIVFQTRLKPAALSLKELEVNMPNADTAQMSLCDGLEKKRLQVENVSTSATRTAVKHNKSHTGNNSIEKNKETLVELKTSESLQSRSRHRPF